MRLRSCARFSDCQQLSYQRAGVHAEVEATADLAQALWLAGEYTAKGVFKTQERYSTQQVGEVVNEDRLHLAALLAREWEALFAHAVGDVWVEWGVRCGRATRRAAAVGHSPCHDVSTPTPT